MSIDRSDALYFTNMKDTIDKVDFLNKFKRIISNLRNSDFFVELSTQFFTEKKCFRYLDNYKLVYGIISFSVKALTKTFVCHTAQWFLQRSNNNEKKIEKKFINIR